MFCFWDCGCKDIEQIQKDIPRKKFLETLSFVLPAKTQFSKLLGLLWFWREVQNSQFSKTFFGGYLLVFVEYLCNCSPKFKTKRIKNYSSILAIVNHRNWLDNSRPLRAFKRNNDRTITTSLTQNQSFLRFIQKRTILNPKLLLPVWLPLWEYGWQLAFCPLVK